MWGCEDVRMWGCGVGREMEDGRGELMDGSKGKGKGKSRKVGIKKKGTVHHHPTNQPTNHRHPTFWETPLSAMAVGRPTARFGFLFLFLFLVFNSNNNSLTLFLYFFFLSKRMFPCTHIHKKKREQERSACIVEDEWPAPSIHLLANAQVASRHLHTCISSLFFVSWSFAVQGVVGLD